MRTLIQRVTSASVSIDNVVKSHIQLGLVILVGIQPDDNSSDIDYLVTKISKLRIFDDHNNVMNLSVMDVNGDILLVSQFTLLADTRKGNRPSYINAARPEIAIPLYEEFIHKMKSSTSLNIQTGTFGADMRVELINNGPVTIWIDSRNK